MRSTLSRSRKALLAPLALAALSLCSSPGCSDPFEPQSSIKSLRVLGVKVSTPYAQPGSKVSLEMLYYDGSPKAFDAQGNRTRQVQVLWLGGCHDPVGDLYYSCFPVLAQQFAKLFPQGNQSGSAGAAGSPGGAPSGGIPPELLKALACDDDKTGPDGKTTEGQGALIALGSKYSCLKIPSDIVARRPAGEIATNLQEGNVPYGLSYVFFIACGGTIKPVEPSQSNAIPLGCFDSTTGEALGADDFIFGYTPVYSYGRPVGATPENDPITNANPALAANPDRVKNLVNQNPILANNGAVTFEGKAYNQPCSQGCPDGSACGRAGVCLPVVPPCTEKKVANCTTYKLKPEVDRASVEKDEAAPPFEGRVPDEVIWAAYYASDGTIERDLTLVNDANKGWNDDYEVKWSPPSAPAGEARVWVVVHDNRGGTAWTWQDVIVK